jgi:alpha-tubulin suppressor-like RCC1 family protein
MPSPEITTNYKGSDGVDLGKKLISKDYLISVYPQIANQIITPELWTWGSTNSGGLGNFVGTSSIGSVCTPVTTLAGGSNWKSVSSSYSVAAIKDDGTLWTWGRGSDGQIGDNTRTNKCTPVTTFVGGNNWKQVSCSDKSTAAIKTDGTLWVWGDNGNGQLGINIFSIADVKCTPVTTFSGGNNWKQVSCGTRGMAAIKTDGTLWTWGDNTFGQNGDNGPTFAGARCTPVTTFVGGNNWKQVFTNGFSTAAIKNDGSLWVWGANNSGQLGINNAVVAARCTPVTTFSGGNNWKQVSCGSPSITSGYMAATKTDGTLWAWGNNTTGQLGINDTTDRYTPVTTFAGGTNWKQVFAGGSGSSQNTIAAIKTDGSLWVWGSNLSRQLGINFSVSSRNTPVTTFAGGTNWKQVSCFSNAMAAIKTSDDLQGI